MIQPFENPWSINPDSSWYSHPLAEWCRRTKTERGKARRITFKIKDYADTPHYYFFQYTNNEGKVWRIAEMNLFLKALLYLCGMRRVK